MLILVAVFFTVKILSDVFKGSSLFNEMSSYNKHRPGLLRGSLGVWWPWLIAGIPSCPVLFTTLLGVVVRAVHLAWEKKKKADRQANDFKIHCTADTSDFLLCLTKEWNHQSSTNVFHMVFSGKLSLLQGHFFKVQKSEKPFDFLPIPIIKLYDTVWYCMIMGKLYYYSVNNQKTGDPGWKSMPFDFTT